MAELGPLELFVLVFPGTEPSGELLNVLATVEDSPAVRVIDVAVVRRHADGHVSAMELADMPPGAVTPARAGYAANHLLDEADLEEVAELLPADNSAMAIIVEHLWAIAVADAVQAAGGELAVSVRIPREHLDAAAADLAGLLR
jgi:uncharacterized membrane protein